jgi:metallo-beta-lactamase family protein
MKLKFCGAAGTTTGSNHLLEVNGQRILLDCGLYQGHRDEAYQINCCFPHFEPSEVDTVILSHAHIDHSGNLPNLCKKGFRGNIFATYATRDLCQIMLADSARIQTGDIEWLNKHRKRRGEDELTPLYDERDAERCMRQFVTLGYDRPMLVAPGVTLRFLDAGHILGSAQVLLEVDDQADGKHKRFLFSGDVGRGGNEILHDPVHAKNIDFLLMESTYGGREHEQGTGETSKLEEVMTRALKRGGKILIPAFAVERTQQLLFVLHQLFEEKRLPVVPVFVDSPLAVSATEIYRLHPECFNDEVYEFLFETRDPFGFEGLTLIRSVAASKDLNARKGQCIVISASGMCEAGRILHHLKNGLDDPRNTVLFVGYCAENTLGRRIRDGEPRVRILGGEYQVKAAIETIDSFSGHADHSELMAWFGAISGPKSNVWLVHGEPTRSAALCDALTTAHPQSAVAVAELGRTVEF